MARLAIWGAIFTLFGSCLGTPVLHGIQEKCKIWIDCPIRLNMAPDSVDDMYEGCENKMEKQVKEKFLPIEICQNKAFQLAWDDAEVYYNSKWATNMTLEKEQIKALYVYSLPYPPIYQKFNKAVRKESSEYKTKFQYHTLHFYLTMAVRTLKSRAEKCVTVYRRTSCEFGKDVLHKEIRFGAFTSSSKGDYLREKTFGNKSCFEMSTCFGADISKFSSIESEREVLIPPYEIFKVTDIQENSEHNKLPCEVVYKLKSTRATLSNLNCALFKKKTSAWS